VVRFACVMLIGCGGSSSQPTVTPDAAPEIDAAVAPSDAASDAAVPPPHVGGWRMAGADAAGSFRVASTGPSALATNRLFHDEPEHKLSAPVIDEHGNLYFTSYQDSHLGDVVSLSPAGAERWRVAAPRDTAISNLALAPSGDLVAVSSIGFFPATQKVVIFDSATGAVRSGAPIVSDLTDLKVAPDGRVYIATLSIGPHHGFEMRPSADAPARWTRATGGRAFAVSPAGDAVVVVEDSDARPATPLEIVSLDPATGAVRWHHTVAAGLDQEPAVSIDRDGSVYVAVSGTPTPIDVLKLSAAGELLWDHTEPSFQQPQRVILGDATVSVGAFGDFFGFTIRKSDGMPLPGAINQCSAPLAADAADRLYLNCAAGVMVTDPLGHTLAQWRTPTTAIALSPDGALYVWPFSTSRQSQLYRIQ